MWMSSSAVEKRNVPASISDKTVSSPSRIARASLSVTMPWAASIAAWAREPSMSWGASRRSKPIEALIASMIASGPPEKRPPHMAFEALSDIGGHLSEGSMKALAAALYLGLLTAANAQGLGDVALEGDMRKLTVAADPAPVPEIEMETPEGGTVTLGAHAGRPVILNFWATWCAPCREEMPALDAVAAKGEVAVVALATGRNTLDGIERFFDEEGIDSLPILLDPDQSAAREMGVLGLPVTVLIDADGREVARLTGGADWDGPEAAAVLEALAGR